MHDARGDWRPLGMHLAYTLRDNKPHAQRLLLTQLHDRNCILRLTCLLVKKFNRLHGAVWVLCSNMVARDAKNLRVVVDNIKRKLNGAFLATTLTLLAFVNKVVLRDSIRKDWN